MGEAGAGVHLRGAAFGGVQDGGAEFNRDQASAAGRVAAAENFRRSAQILEPSPQRGLLVPDRDDDRDQLRDPD
jgi:hypothetical protein